MTGYRSLLFVLLLCCSPGISTWASAQVQWEQLPSAPSGLTVIQVCPGVNGQFLASSGAGTFLYDPLDGRWRRICDIGSRNLAVSPQGRIYFEQPNLVRPERIYQSEDGGSTWRVFSSDTMANVGSLTVLPDETVIAGTGDGIYGTPPDGSGWKRMGFAGEGVWGIAAGNDGKLYAIVGYPSAGVFFSRDRGATWERLTTGWDVREMAVDSAGTVYVATAWDHLLRRTTNLGQSWRVVAEGVSSDVEGIACDSDSLIVIGFGTPGAIKRSTDRGMTWTQASAPCQGNQFGVSSLTMAANGTLVAGMENDDGALLSTDAGRTWLGSNSGLLPLTLSSLEYSHSTRSLLAGTTTGLFASEDGGAAWRNALCDAVQDVLPLPNGWVFAATGANLVRSSDLGLSWSVSAEGGPFIMLDGTTSGLAFVQSDSYWANRPFMRSTDDGAGWSVIFSGGGIRVGGVTRGADGSLFAAFRDPVYRGVYRSRDDGATWQQTTLSQASVLSVAADERRNILYAADEYGATFRSLDGGDNWSLWGAVDQPYSLRLLVDQPSGVVFLVGWRKVYRHSPTGFIWDVILDVSMQFSYPPVFAIDSSGFAYAGTEAGIRRTSNPVTGVGEDGESEPKTFGLLQNYPNPFNPTTGIRYQVSGVSDVRLSVYDILGREVAVLVNERKDAGVYEVKFDASRSASGVYVYRLVAGHYVEARKMIVVK